MVGNTTNSYHHSALIERHTPASECENENGQPPTKRSDTTNCTPVTPTCPIEATAYGYRPNLGSKATFATIFTLWTIYNLIIGIRSRQVMFKIALTLGSLMETAGYIGRIITHNNPWNNSGVELQIICLVLVSSFVVAGILAIKTYRSLHRIYTNERLDIAKAQAMRGPTVGRGKLCNLKGEFYIKGELISNFRISLSPESKHESHTVASKGQDFVERRPVALIVLSQPAPPP